MRRLHSDFAEDNIHDVFISGATGRLMSRELGYLDASTDRVCLWVDKVYVILGCNDLRQATHITEYEIVKFYTSIFLVLRKFFPNAMLIHVPVFKVESLSMSAINWINSIILSVVKSYANMFQCRQPAIGERYHYSHDGVYLTRAGYRRLSELCS